MINKSLNKVHCFFIVLSIFVLVGIDFFSKNFAVNNFFYDTAFPKKELVIYKDFLGTSLSLFLTFNKGAAFGWFSKHQPLLLGARLIITLGIFTYLLLLKTSKILQISLTLIVAGAVGNIIDFFLYGHVIDFISFKIFSYHFPVFNFADCFIFFGTILLIIFFLKKNNMKKI